MMAVDEAIEKWYGGILALQIKPDLSKKSDILQHDIVGTP